ILTVPWSRSNRLQFAADACVWHLNRTELSDLMAHQYRLGRSFPAVCDRVEVPYRRYSHWPLLTTAPALRLAALGVRLARQPAMLSNAARLSPLLTLGLAAWGAGVATAR